MAINYPNERSAQVVLAGITERKSTGLSAMMNFMRRYGWYIFLVPSAIFIADDILTNWHDHGHERTLYIVLENFGEDIAALIFYFVIRAWENRVIPHMHAECPSCHAKWVMHPKQRMLFCPHCGAPERRPENLASS